MNRWYEFPGEQRALDLGVVCEMSENDRRPIWVGRLFGERFRYGVSVGLLGCGNLTYWYDDETERDVSLRKLTEAFARWRESEQRRAAQQQARPDRDCQQRAAQEVADRINARLLGHGEHPADATDRGEPKFEATKTVATNRDSPGVSKR